MEKLTIGSIEYRIGFDFSTLLEIEETFNTDFATFIQGDRTMKDNLKFLYACLKAFNPGIAEFGEWLHTVGRDDVKTLNEAIIEAQNKFFDTPGIAESHLPELSDEEKAEAAKNA